MNPLPSAAAPARSSCPPAWQTVGLRARALAELFQPGPEAGPRPASPWPQRFAWAHHGICLALVLELVVASLLPLASPSRAPAQLPLDGPYLPRATLAQAQPTGSVAPALLQAAHRHAS